MQDVVYRYQKIFDWLNDQDWFKEHHHELNVVLGKGKEDYLVDAERSQETYLKLTELNCGVCGEPVLRNERSVKNRTQTCFRCKEKRHRIVAKNQKKYS